MSKRALLLGAALLCCAASALGGTPASAERSVAFLTLGGTPASAERSVAVSTKAGTPATEAQWIAAATRAVEYGRAHGMPISLEIQAGNGLPGHTPIGLASENGLCTLVVSVRHNPTADKLSAMIDPSLLELFLDGAAMHELGHCHRRLNGYPHNERLLGVVAWIRPVQDWFNRRVRREEAYADMVEVAWLARHHPQRFHALLEQIVKVRLRFREPRHDTLPWLHTALAEGPLDAPGTLFSLADKLMARPLLKAGG